MVARGQQNNLRCVVFFRLTFVVALWLMNNEKKIVKSCMYTLLTVICFIIDFRLILIEKLECGTELLIKTGDYKVNN